ncbi:MAG: extracellular solute-binding protein [Chloroflexi bacterium]|nr:extracellular solute-binding protein [Chloroflexota bacterium]
MRRIIPVFMLLLIPLLAACSLLGQSGDVSPSPTVTATAVPPPDTPQPVSTIDLGLSEPLTPTKPVLTVWISPEILNASEAGTAVLQQQLNQFQADHPDIELIVEPKAVSGQGSILNYLRTGRNTAPTVLPDLITLPADQLNIALNEELIYPQNGLIDTDLLGDLYPAGLEMALNEDQIHGYPFVFTNMPHLAINTAVYSGTIPLRWDKFIEIPEQTFAFPANGAPGATLLLEFYLAEGGSLENEAGQPALEIEPLAVALSQISLGRENEFILAQSSNLGTLPETWKLLEGGSATFVQTSAEQYLQNRNSELPVDFHSIPGPQRSLTPLVRGWAWAISSAEPGKQSMALELMMTLIEAENLAEWSAAAAFLPARRSAYDFWPSRDPYVPFARRELAQARPHPLNPNSKMITVLENALFDVISLNKTPQEAAEEAVAALQE